VGLFIYDRIYGEGGEKMKHFSDVIPGIALALAVTIGAFFFWQQKAESPGKTIKESRAVSDFNKVSLSGSGLVVIKQGEKESLTIEASEKLMEYISTEVVDSELQLSYKDYPSSYFPTDKVKFYLTLSEVEKVTLNGSGKFEGSVGKADELELIVNGSGKMDLNLEAEQLTAELTGSGSFKLEGTATTQQVLVSGSGSFSGRDLKGKAAKVALAGSGSVEVNVSDELDVSLDGSGSVRYLGNPKLGETDVSGSGRFEKI
jgi:hypothetical protein